MTQIGKANIPSRGPLTGKALQDYLAKGAKERGLDPAAVLAVASVEGGFSGAIGDKGTSFGPFQLHIGGALPPGKTNEWARSKAGLDYALDRIASVAKGLTGQMAVHSIVYKFERPRADLRAGEVTRAMAAYASFNDGTYPGIDAKNPLSLHLPHIPNPLSGPLSGIEAIGAFFAWFGKPNEHGVTGIIRVIEVGAGIVVLGYGLSLLTKEAVKENVPGSRTANRTVKHITSIAMPKIGKVAKSPIGAAKKAFTPSKEQVEKITLKEEKPAETKPTPKARSTAQRSQAAKKGVTKTRDRESFWTGRV